MNQFNILLAAMLDKKHLAINFFGSRSFYIPFACEFGVFYVDFFVSSKAEDCSAMQA